QLQAEAKGLRLGDIVSGQSTQKAAVSSFLDSKAASARHSAGTDAGAPAAAPAKTDVAGTEGRPRVIAVFNHKGGTGKTTSAVTLAAGLARAGKRTLLVDTDAQGNVGVSLGIKPTRSLYHVLVMG